jgi:hypothetical protein
MCSFRKIGDTRDRESSCELGARLAVLAAIFLMSTDLVSFLRSRREGAPARS